MSKMMRNSISCRAHTLWLLPARDSSDNLPAAAEPEASRVRRLLLDWWMTYGKVFAERNVANASSDAGKENALLKRGVMPIAAASFSIRRVVPFEAVRTVGEHGVKKREDVWIQRGSTFLH